MSKTEAAIEKERTEAGKQYSCTKKNKKELLRTVYILLWERGSHKSAMGRKGS